MHENTTFYISYAPLRNSFTFSSKKLMSFDKVAFKLLF